MAASSKIIRKDYEPGEASALIILSDEIPGNAEIWKFNNMTLPVKVKIRVGSHGTAYELEGAVSEKGGIPFWFVEEWLVFM